MHSWQKNWANKQFKCKIDDKLTTHEQVIDSNVNKLDSLNTEVCQIKNAVKETANLGLRQLGERDEQVQSQLQKD
jgi:hypothetical protein